jgi:hypothetical protein
MADSDATKSVSEEDRLSAAITKGLAEALPNAIKPLVDQISETGRITRQVAEPAAPRPVIDDVSEEDYLEAVEAGDKQKAAQLLRRLRAADRSRLEREVIDPIRQQGAAAFGSVAKIGAERLPYYKRFKKEIDEAIDNFQRANPGVVITPDHYEQAHRLIVGAHADELIKEAREEAIRQREEHEAGGALDPTGTRIGEHEEDREPTSLQEVLVGDWKAELKRKQRELGSAPRSDEYELALAGFKGGVKEFVQQRRRLAELVDTLGEGLGLDADWMCEQHSLLGCRACSRANKSGVYMNNGRSAA